MMRCRKYVAVAPYHGYDFKDYAEMAELHRKYPDIPLWMTEVCYAYEAGNAKIDVPATLRISRTETFGVLKSSNDLEAHASAWIY